MKSEENKGFSAPKNYIATNMVVAEVLGLELEHLELKRNECVNVEYAKDSEYKYCAIGNIPLDDEMISSAVWCSLAHYSIVAKHPKLARTPIFRGLIIFWCKLRYYLFDKRPNVAFELAARRIFPVLFGDKEAEIVTRAGICDSYYDRICRVIKCSAFLRISVCAPFQKAKIFFQNIFGYFSKSFVVHKKSPSLSGDVPEANEKAHRAEGSGAAQG